VRVRVRARGDHRGAVAPAARDLAREAEGALPLVGALEVSRLRLGDPTDLWLGLCE